MSAIPAWVVNMGQVTHMCGLAPHHSTVWLGRAPFLAFHAFLVLISRVSRSQINSAATSHVSFQRGPFIKRVSPNEHGTCQPMVARAKWFYSVRKVTREQARAKEEKHTHRKQPPLHVSSRRKKNKFKMCRYKRNSSTQTPHAESC